MIIFAGLSSMAGTLPKNRRYRPARLLERPNLWNDAMTAAAVAITVIPAARPSSPSMKFIALVMPTIQR